MEIACLCRFILYLIGIQLFLLFRILKYQLKDRGVAFQTVYFWNHTGFLLLHCCLLCHLMIVIWNADITCWLSIASIHPPPAFGSSPNLEALAIEANNSHNLDGDNSVHANVQFSR